MKVRWIVRCVDGQVRHEGSFESFADADHWAGWEHGSTCHCVHTIEPEDQNEARIIEAIVALETVRLEKHMATAGCANVAWADHFEAMRQGLLRNL